MTLQASSKYSLQLLHLAALALPTWEARKYLNLLRCTFVKSPKSIRRNQATSRHISSSFLHSRSRERNPQNTFRVQTQLHSTHTNQIEPNSTRTRISRVSQLIHAHISISTQKYSLIHVTHILIQDVPAFSSPSLSNLNSPQRNLVCLSPKFIWQIFHFKILFQFSQDYNKTESTIGSVESSLYCAVCRIITFISIQ